MLRMIIHKMVKIINFCKSYILQDMQNDLVIA